MRANRQRIATRRQQETTQAREARCVCIRPGLCLSVCFSVLRALVACKQSLVAIEFSQYRHRRFRIVIASLQIGATAQRRVQRKHFETTLRTPPAHTQAAGEPTKTSYEVTAGDITNDRREVCVCVSVLGCCLLYTSPSPRDRQKSRMPSSA